MVRRLPSCRRGCGRRSRCSAWVRRWRWTSRWRWLASRRPGRVDRGTAARTVRSGRCGDAWLAGPTAVARRSHLRCWHWSCVALRTELHVTNQQPHQHHATRTSSHSVEYSIFLPQQVFICRFLSFFIYLLIFANFEMSTTVQTKFSC